MGNLIYHPLRSLTDVAFPETKHGVAAFGEVGILGYVNCHSSALAIVWVGEPVWVAMPVITIELDDQIARRNERINTKLSADHELTFIRNADGVKQFVAKAFEAVRLEALLLEVHLAKHSRSFRVFVAAFNRTVDRVRLCAGWRPTERLAAHFAGVLVFIAPLPRDLMLKTTEIVFGLCHARGGKIDRFPAIFTRDLGPVSSLPGVSNTTTFAGAVPLLARNDRPACGAWMVAGLCAFNSALRRAVFASAFSNVGWTWPVVKRFSADSACSLFQPLAVFTGTLKTAKALARRKAASYLSSTVFACNRAGSVWHMHIRSALLDLWSIAHSMRSFYFQHEIPSDLLEYFEEVQGGVENRVNSHPT